MNAERERRENQRQGTEPWDLWGPYLSERAWGTVREDYSPDGQIQISDMDGVITRTASVHQAAWREMFDAYQREAHECIGVRR